MDGATQSGVQHINNKIIIIIIIISSSSSNRELIHRAEPATLIQVKLEKLEYRGKVNLCKQLFSLATGV